jgi:hypothetical protein
MWSWGISCSVYLPFPTSPRPTLLYPILPSRDKEKFNFYLPPPSFFHARGIARRTPVPIMNRGGRFAGDVGNVKYDPKDALMAYQSQCSKAYSTDSQALLKDYFATCAAHADSSVARDAHQSFIHQVELQRSVLVTQGKQMTPGGSSVPVIVRNEWGKEQFRKMRALWNAHGVELVQQAMEASVNWLLRNTASDQWSSMIEISSETCYCSHLGLVIQKWQDKKDAKNFVQALHAVLNAPLSKFFTPFTTFFEILGQPIVAMTLAPVSREWSSWTSVPMAVHAFSCVCATLRFTKALSIATATGTKSNDAMEYPFEKMTKVKPCLGSDGRYYILDARDIVLRGGLISELPAAKRCPRRELLFSPAGVCSTPYNHLELIQKFKLKAIVENLVTGGYFSEEGSGASGGGGGRDGPVNGSGPNLVSTLMHFHGLSNGAYIFQLYYSITEQERVFRSSLQTANRKETTMTPQAAAKLSKYAACKTALLSELFGRVLKRIVRAEWDWILKSSDFAEQMKEYIAAEEALGDEDSSQEEDDTDDTDDEAGARAARRAQRQQREVAHQYRLKALNQPFISTLDVILRSFFTTTTASPATSSPSVPTAASVASAGSKHGGKQGGKDTAGGKDIAVASAMLEEIFFILNDAFVTKVFGDRVGAAAAASGSDQPAAEMKFSGTEEEIDARRVVEVFTALTGVNLVVKGGKVTCDPQTNIFTSFFDLESTAACPLRSEAVSTSLELPVCLVAGTRSKMMDFVNLQQRIASKIMSSVTTATNKDALSSLLLTAKYILLYATDTTVAYRGLLQDSDYEDVLALKLPVQNVPTALTMRLLTCVETDITIKRALLLASTDLAMSLKLLVKYGEKTRTLFDSPEGTALVVAEKIAALCKVCEHFSNPSLISALEAVIQDLTLLTNSNNNKLSGVTLVNSSKASATKSTSAANSKGDQSELSPLHAAHLFLYPLSLLIRHILQPDNSRSLNDSLSLAVRYATRRRDIIKGVFGETSVETGVACNDIAAICSNNKFDFEKAETEFERAVLILSEAEPQGPTVFVAMNNLAFLYFRKAERIKKQPGLNQDPKVDSKTLMNQWLDKAHRLLEEVLAAEASMNPLDFAAALNNLASIRVFEGKLKEAEELFTRTLQVTAPLQKEGQELPCRAHANRNLKALAKKQYVHAVIKVQAHVKRFIYNLKNRKTLRQIRSSLPIQRMGRGYLARLFLAKNYRFSGFYCWLRQPTVFSRKLDSTFRQLPVAARRNAWEQLCQSKAFQLQRVLRAYFTRLPLGCIWNFQRAFITRRFPVVVAEVDRRRALMFSGESLKWFYSFGMCFWNESFELKLKCINYEMYIKLNEIQHGQRVEFKLLLQDEEMFRRRAIELESRRCFNEIIKSSALLTLEASELRARRTLAIEALIGATEPFRQRTMMEEEKEFRLNIVFRKQREYLEFLEAKMRKLIAVELFTELHGQQFVARVPRIARAFMTRRLLRHVQKLLRAEELSRQMVIAEEKSVISFDSLKKDWRLIITVNDETNIRAAMEAQMLRYLQFESFEDHGSVEVLEIPKRIQVMQLERRDRFELVKLHQRHHLQVVEANKRQDLFVSQWLEHRTQIVAAMESREYAMLSRLEAKDLKTAFEKSIMFALAVEETKEERRRSGLIVVEYSERILGIVFPGFYYAPLRQREDGEWSTLLKSMQRTIARQTEKEREERRQEFERREVEQAEDVERKKVQDSRLELISRLRGELSAQIRLTFVTAVVLERQQLHKMHMTEEAILEKWCHGHAMTYASLAALLNIREGISRQGLLQDREEECSAALTSYATQEFTAMRSKRLELALGSLQQLCREESQECLYYEAYHELLVLFLRAAQSPLYGRMVLYQVNTEEEKVRLSLEDAEKSDRRQLLETQCIEGRLAAVVSPCRKEWINLGLPFYETCERLARVAIQMQRSRQLALGFVEAEELTHRLVLSEQTVSVSLAALYMLSLHSQYLVQRLYPTFHNGWNTISTNCEREAERRRSTLMIVRLQKLGRGLLLRRHLGKVSTAELFAVRKLQRIGRAFYARRRLSVYFAEFIEHCIHYAKEIEARREIEEEEQLGRRGLAQYTLFHGTRFLRFRAQSSMGSFRPASQLDSRAAQGKGANGNSTRPWSARSRSPRTQPSSGLAASADKRSELLSSTDSSGRPLPMPPASARGSAPYSKRSSSTLYGANVPSPSLQTPDSSFRNSPDLRGGGEKSPRTPRVNQKVSERLFSTPSWVTSELFLNRFASAIPMPVNTLSREASIHARKVADEERRAFSPTRNRSKTDVFYPVHSVAAQPSYPNAESPPQSGSSSSSEVISRDQYVESYPRPQPPTQPPSAVPRRAMSGTKLASNASSRPTAVASTPLTQRITRVGSSKKY